MEESPAGVAAGSAGTQERDRGIAEREEGSVCCCGTSLTALQAPSGRARLLEATQRTALHTKSRLCLNQIICVFLMTLFTKYMVKAGKVQRTAKIIRGQGSSM